MRTKLEPVAFLWVIAPVMARRIGIVSLLLAWICANGAALELVQCAAWVKMFIGYAPHMSVVAALDETFDPAKPCEICTNVAKARATQPETPATAPAALEKIILVLQVNHSPVIEQPASVVWPHPAHIVAASRAEAVPLRPPRA